MLPARLGTPAQAYQADWQLHGDSPGWADVHRSAIRDGIPFRTRAPAGSLEGGQACALRGSLAVFNFYRYRICILIWRITEIANAHRKYPAVHHASCIPGSWSESCAPCSRHTASARRTRAHALASGWRVAGGGWHENPALPSKHSHWYCDGSSGVRAASTLEARESKVRGRLEGFEFC